MSQSAIVLGVGAANGVGGALAFKFAREGLHVFVAGRTQAKLDKIVSAIEAEGGSAEACVVDVTDESAQDALFARVAARGEPLASVLYNAGNNAMIPFARIEPDQFEQFWRVSCFGGFLTAKRAMPMMEAQGHGSMLFTGASASLRGKPMFAHFAAAKAAERNLAQALAREYGPKGVHVGHVVIDGVINGDIVQNAFGDYLDNLGEDGALEPSAIADAFWMLHSQSRSAWAFEIDLRPFKENW